MYEAYKNNVLTYLFKLPESLEMSNYANEPNTIIQAQAEEDFT